MPQWYFDCEMSWLNWWHAHPTVWCCAMLASIAVVIGHHVLKQRL